MRARLTLLLSCILETSKAAAVSLQVIDGDTRELLLSSSIGGAEEALAAYLSGMGEVREPIQLDVHAVLGPSGISSLLGVPLAAGNGSLGVMWVGIRERRMFTNDEYARIIQLSELTVTHLENARLEHGLQSKVEALEGESALRERFISMLMHDLGAPLAAAKLNAALVSGPAQPRAARVLGAAILHSLEQVERMVGDLVDTHRIRAGQRLAMPLADCNLTELAREALEGLHAIHGDRFLLKCDRSVRGVWNGDQLRRAIWNLCENAIKFGAEDAPIVISVTSQPEGAELTVHNEGSAIPAAEQQKLFAPFSSTRSAIDGHPRGWGLGLTLIWGCADAHGGRVSVASQGEEGTTFRMMIPLDARPYFD
jgi:signal transduction histidine kinase